MTVFWCTVYLLLFSLLLTTSHYFSLHLYLWELFVAAPGRRVSPLTVGGSELTHHLLWLVLTAVLGLGHGGLQAVLAAAGEVGEESPDPGRGRRRHCWGRCGPEISHSSLGGWLAGPPPSQSVYCSLLHLQTFNTQSGSQLTNTSALTQLTDDWYSVPTDGFLTDLNKVVREHSSVAGQFSLPPAPLHPLHLGDHIPHPQAQLVRQLGRVLVESHHLLTSLHLSGADHWVEMSHVYVSLLATGL